MEREILFKAKRADNGQWVKGDRVKGERCYIVTSQNMYNAVVSLSGHASITFVEVNPETLCQFTGLTDKNGTKIFEGDEIKFHYFYGTLVGGGFSEAEHELKGIVKYGEYGWGVECIKGDHFQGYTGYYEGEGFATWMELMFMNESGVHEESFEVTGNIHDTTQH